MKRTKLVAVAALFMLLTACGLAPSSHQVVEQKGAGGSARQGGTLVVPLTNFDTLNPLLTENESYYQLSNLLYDRLFVYEGSGRMVPSIADHVDVSDGGKRVSVTIKKDIYWQDGTPITTKDVAETFDAVKHGPDDAVYKAMIRRSTGAGSNLDAVARAVVFDDRNIDFEFDRPYGNYMELLSFPILPAHIYGEAGMLEKDDFKVVASGPFTLKRWDKNKRIFLEKNQNYHGSLPYIDEIKGLIFSDKDAIHQAYDAGQVDVCVIDDYTWDRYRTDKTSSVEPYETQSMEVVALNTKDPLLRDPKLRRAIDLSINKQRIIDSLYLSQGTMANFFINPKLSGGLFTKEESYMSVDSAISLLEKSGYRDIDGDGYREDTSGAPLTIEIASNVENHRMRTEAQTIAEDLKKVGIRAHLKEMDAAPKVDDDASSRKKKETPSDLNQVLTSGNFQMAIVGMDFSAVPDLRAVLGSSSAGGMNISRYGNAEMDDLLNQLARSGDDAERKVLVGKIYQLFRRDVPYIPLVFKQRVLVTGPRVEGEMRPNAFSVYNGIEDIQIRATRAEGK
ncbi:MAG: peptide ABC transporter substrate-binding protein [Peptoniphilus sp.]|nr:peptide ABC transporter substrate-binding protein [Peptoniphilus sp.]MDD7363316.1 peptide ABC transporter substrate-binding protein [Bacillota bacterium]MDY6044051.1 peptide ABC transporter substrate-binding protein [Peptoniphilus sp.]